MRREIWLVGIGAALAVGGICWELVRPGPVPHFLVLLPTIYAAGLAGFCFWIRSKGAAVREQAFWQLWSLGSTLWIISDVANSMSRSFSLGSTAAFFSMAFTFLPTVAFMAALVMQPDVIEAELRDPVVAYEAALVTLWWMYLYILVLSPWHWLTPNAAEYQASFQRLHELQNAALLLWLAALALVSRGSWQRVYGQMTGAIALLAPTVGLFYMAWNGNRWLMAMVFQALLAAAFLWLSVSSLIPARQQSGTADDDREPGLGTGTWLASLTAFGIPVLAIWSGIFGQAPEAVQHFRLFVSFGTLVVGVFIVYRWQNAADEQRERLVADLETSVGELRSLQSHFAEAEKLASLGQLAAGAAHEINNPVAAMLGYSELLRGDVSAPDRVHELGRKIGEQTRRIRNLVHNLLGLAEQADQEVSLVDIAALLQSAVELLRISGTNRNLASVLLNDAAPLEVRGNPEKLLQVFYRLLLALSEDEGKTSVEIRTRREGSSGNVSIEFVGRAKESSSHSPSPELCDARKALKGTGLSLGVCDTIVKEHGGAIAHESPIDGGRMFRVELPLPEPSRSLPMDASPA